MASEPIVDTGMIIWTDPPKHTRLRKLVSRAFTARSGCRRSRTRMREVCAELLDPHLGEASFDYVQDFSAVLPPTMISMLLGVPEGTATTCGASSTTSSTSRRVPSGW